MRFWVSIKLIGKWWWNHVQHLGDGFLLTLGSQCPYENCHFGVAFDDFDDLNSSWVMSIHGWFPKYSNGEKSRFFLCQLWDGGYPWHPDDIPLESSQWLFTPWDPQVGDVMLICGGMDATGQLGDCTLDTARIPVRLFLWWRYFIHLSDGSIFLSPTEPEILGIFYEGSWLPA